MKFAWCKPVDAEETGEDKHEECKLLATIGNGCLERPDDPVCKGTEELLDQATYIEQDGTTVYLYKC